ncbi:flavin-containing monooxygenase [Lutimaribacter saemankumensis]|uniref:Trimethylamine monooxygenase n=1 Tax=Lutimaribacter saemankumensis TaxID=490829 RepID=A0A1G8K7B5_9RHOB|nr:NAD(P)/FAD-dependent oxidoreductase [Lutimaribacter saemankumensis]SDI38710.1 Predicted flavoprotein CzcO associated with the cation diffusion facilitator CzcD [Lutimaribacter saemankumensis]
MKIAVIGAGFAGLATIKHLKDFGHDVTVYEKVGDVGGVWSASRTYPGITTQNGKDTYHLSDYPMPKSYPEWPTGPQVQAYLEDYAEHFGLMPDIRLNTEVKATRQEPDGRWVVVTENGEETFDHLVIANGIFSRPAVPSFEGQEAFIASGGRVCHSSEFLDLSDARGQNVVVIGYGKSSCDVAAAVAEVASNTTVVAREIIWKSPRRFMNVLNYKYLLLTRMGEGLFKYIRPKGFEKFLHGVGKPIRNQMVGTVQGITTRQLKLRKLGLVPEGPFEKIARSTVSLATDGFYDLVAEKRIVVERDTEIARLELVDGSRFAVLKNGKKVPADIIICGTGWHQEIPFLDPNIKGRIFDAKGNFRLYNCVKPIGVQNLTFNGYNSSFFSALSAEIGALWTAAYIGGDISLPSESEQARLTDERLAWMEKRTEGKHARGTNVIPFSMHQIDELLDDLRLPIPRLQRFMEWQRPIKPSSYTKIAKRLKQRMGA